MSVASDVARVALARGSSTRAKYKAWVDDSGPIDADGPHAMFKFKHRETVTLVVDLRTRMVISWDGWSASDRDSLNDVLGELRRHFGEMVQPTGIGFRHMKKVNELVAEIGSEVIANPNYKPMYLWADGEKVRNPEWTRKDNPPVLPNPAYVRFNKDMTIANTGEAQLEDKAKEGRMTQAIKVFMDRIDSGALPMPDGGECWYITMFKNPGVELTLDYCHKECEFYGQENCGGGASFLWGALKERGYRMPAVFLADENGPSLEKMRENRSIIRRALECVFRNSPPKFSAPD